MTAPLSSILISHHLSSPSPPSRLQGAKPNPQKDIFSFFGPKTAGPAPTFKRDETAVQVNQCTPAVTDEATAGAASTTSSSSTTKGKAVSEKKPRKKRETKPKAEGAAPDTKPKAKSKAPETVRKSESPPLHTP